MLTQEKTNFLRDYWKSGSDEDFGMAEEVANKTSGFVAALFFLHLALEKALKAQLQKIPLSKSDQRIYP